MSNSSWTPADDVEPLEERTYRFALRIVRLVLALPDNVVGRRLGDQALRSGTSVGANVEEAIGTLSRRDFAHRMSIAWREARETHYWLRLIRDSELLKPAQMEPLIQEALEIKRILGKTTSTARKPLRERRVTYHVKTTRPSKPTSNSAF